MDAGRVIAEGSVEEITRSVLFEETMALEVKDPSAALIEGIKQIQGVISCEAIGQSLTITSTADAANMHRILELAMPYVILGVTANRSTLEDAFLALTGKKLRDGGEG